MTESHEVEGESDPCERRAELRAGSEDPVVAGQRQTQVGADAGAADRRNDRLGHDQQVPHDGRVVVAHGGEGGLGPVLQTLGTPSEVLSYAERLARRGQDHRTHALVGGDRVAQCDLSSTATPRHGERRSVMSQDHTCPGPVASSTGAARGVFACRLVGASGRAD